MKGRYQVRAYCQAYGCRSREHKEVIRTIDHASSFSFALWMNGAQEHEERMTCPGCGSRMYYYPVSCISEPDYHA
ncbi:hypothetical protein PM3016_3213 [Paenibacillus mucilaginosus 3016]|uniref:Uncharacterized protein n=3 Tax=Paenibacillus mucilaginosus TaxID=61624 RepID=H6NFI2_9BACL|nr:hypothetical protein KNP414_02973 [Paenibacillus mucilaginosus KNP414]AFC30068.1 hypothetical protein PM3016_3213 [Paenibacillus mucilaginosus 3016]AFH62330.1 hypothetical protein B2K_16650 [Paenibacillus mucilaginosus K02]WFA18720.1 hypothetical protein ERY13_16265 [Paenibacillus mucilaginosus]